MAHQSALIQQDIKAYLRQQEAKSILRVLTCGSVDDGKSTLIGRLLHDSKMIYEDQLAAVASASKKVGTQGDEVDLALLVDGLQAEREQGITIDVAYRYFSTEKRKFIIADTPGHEQYTRNMVTGASNAEAAIILVDARPGHGVLTQTKRHTFIAALLAIKHLVVAVNKMDAVDYSAARFEEIKAAYLAFANKLNIQDLHFVPISALKGDNIVTSSTHMPWYQGSPLLYLLENLHIASARNHVDFRFPVQYVNRPNSDFRAYSGTLASGGVKVGDTLMVLPSGQRSRLGAIHTFDGQQDQAHCGEAVNLVLTDAIDVSRGDMLVKPDNTPALRDHFEMMLVWMAQEPARPGQQYLFKINAQQIVGEISKIRHQVDINDFEHLKASHLKLNEIAQVQIKLTRAVPVDPYLQNKETGSLIIIDRISNLTLGAGMILPHDAGGQKDVWAADPKTVRRKIRHLSKVSADDRAALLGHRAVTVAFVGPNGVGKTALAIKVERVLFKRKVLATIVDGQHIRLGLTRDLGFTAAERAENLRRGTEVARHINNSGAIALCCFVAPNEASRQRAKETIGAERFLLVHLDAPVDVCRARDTQDLYAAAERGEIADFPGVSATFEAPDSPHLYLPTDQLGLDECTERVITLLETQKIISAQR